MPEPTRTVELNFQVDVTTEDPDELKQVQSNLRYIVKEAIANGGITHGVEALLAGSDVRVSLLPPMPITDMEQHYQFVPLSSGAFLVVTEDTKLSPTGPELHQVTIGWALKDSCDVESYICNIGDTVVTTYNNAGDTSLLLSGGKKSDA